MFPLDFLSFSAALLSKLIYNFTVLTMQFLSSPIVVYFYRVIYHTITQLLIFLLL